jgi:hypothetical protein
MGRVIAISVGFAVLLGAVGGVCRLLLAHWFGTEAPSWLGPIVTGLASGFSPFSVPLLRIFHRDRWILCGELRRKLDGNPGDVRPS